MLIRLQQYPMFARYGLMQTTDERKQLSGYAGLFASKKAQICSVPSST